MHTTASKMASQIEEGFHPNGMVSLNEIKSKSASMRKKKKIKLKLVLLTPTAAHFLKAMYQILL